MVKKKLPEFVFVHYEPSDPGKFILLAEDKVEDSVRETSDSEMVGRYQLLETMEVHGTARVIHHPTRIGPSKKKKRN